MCGKGREGGQGEKHESSCLDQETLLDEQKHLWQWQIEKTHDQTGSCRYSWRKQKEVGTEEIWVESNTTHSLKGSTAFPLALYHLKSKGPFYLPVKDKPFKNQSIFITMWKRLSFALGSRRKPACVHSYYLCRGHCISESMSYSKANYVYKRFVSTVTADAHFTVTLLSQKKQ